MATAFQEFSNTYEEFVREFPDHPLTDQIRHGIALDRFPEERWLRDATKKMKDMLEPLWMRL